MPNWQKQKTKFLILVMKSKKCRIDKNKTAKLNRYQWYNQRILFGKTKLETSKKIELLSKNLEEKYSSFFQFFFHKIRKTFFSKTLHFLIKKYFFFHSLLSSWQRRLFFQTIHFLCKRKWRVSTLLTS